MTKQDDNGNGIERHRVAVVTLTYDLETFLLTVSGSCPTTELAKALCLMGAEECEHKLEEKRIRQRLAIAGPEILEQLRNRG